jgi:acetyl esterase/lipase
LAASIAALAMVLLGAGLLIFAAARNGDGTALSLPGGGTLMPNAIYAIVDGHELKLDIITPPENGEARPIVVFFHGGAWRSGDKSAGARYLLPLVNAGFIGITANYRLSREADFPAQIHDCKAVVRWVRYHARDFGGDPSRIAVIGSSAGGHLAALLGTSGGVAELEGSVGDHANVGSEVQAVVNWFGPTDLALLSDEVNDWHLEVLSELLGGDPRDQQELTLAASAVTYIDASDPPVLIIHGDADSTVPVEQSRAFHAALLAAGVDVEYIEVPGGGHGRFHGTSPDQSELIQEMIMFLDQRIGNAK